MFPNYLEESILGRALEKELWSYNLINIRDFTDNKWGRVDDTPYGGGAGMIIQAEPIAKALESVGCHPPTSHRHPREGGDLMQDQEKDYRFRGNDKAKNSHKIIYLSPRGRKFTQSMAKQLATQTPTQTLTLLCGRYEGIDQRIIDEYNIEEVSVGDYIVSGGELPAMLMIDAILRNIDGVLGNAESLAEESHNEEGDLEYDLYTKPEIWRKREVPQVLKSGNHAEIAKWRKENSKPKS